MTDPDTISADYTLRPSELAATLTLLVEARQPVIVWGPPGAAKSMIAQQVAADAGRQYVDVRALLLDPVDLRGIPWRDGTDRTRWAPPAFLPPTDDPGRWLINLEELPSAVPMVQAALYQLVLDRKVGEYELPEGASLIACGNRESDRGVTHRMPTPLASRFVHLEVRVDAEDWCAWAAANGIAAEVVFFVSMRPELLHQFDPQSREKAFPCPRTWEMISNIVHRRNGLDPAVERALFRGTVADADGLTKAEGGEAGHAYSWQWIRVDGVTETAISGATSKTYRLMAADVGKKFKVKLSFSDDDGNAESRTSAAYPAALTSLIVTNAAPTGADETVTLAEDGSYAFKAADFGFADSDTGDALASVKIMTLPSAGTLALDGAAAGTDQVIAAADIGKLTFGPAANGHGDPYATFIFKVSDGTTESASAYTMTIDVTAVNDAAAGAPAISGTARKGLTLIASKGTVADADGLTRAEGGETGHAYSWHWLRVDGGSETAISGATSKTYTLVAADVGKKIKVRVTFSDDDGNAESRTSAAYPSGTVGDSNAPTGAAGTVTTQKDTSYVFKAADFGFADSDTGDALASVKVATLPASGKGTLALDGTAATAGQSVTKADLDAGDLAFGPAANGHGDPYASFTFKVSDGILESASAYTMTVDVTAVNDAATGAPSISGTPRVGRTLTASKGTVANADGLTKAEGGEAGHAYSWQWIRVDGVTETAISGATSKTYRLMAADVGKKFKVKLSFSDDDGNAESRTSAAYPAALTSLIVTNAAPTGPGAMRNGSQTGCAARPTRRRRSAACRGR